MIRFDDEDGEYLEEALPAPFVETEIEKLQRLFDAQGDVLARACEEHEELRAEIAALEDALEEMTIQRDEFREQASHVHA